MNGLINWTKSNKKKSVLIAIILLLFITNPSPNSFKGYLGKTSEYGLRRTANFIICSIYNEENVYYLGLFNNFIELHNNIKNNSAKDAVSIKSSGIEAVDEVKPVRVLTEKEAQEILKSESNH